MKGKVVCGTLLTLLILSMLTLTSNISHAYVQSETLLYVDPSRTKALVHSEFTINVTIADVVDLYAFGFHLGYDTAVLDISTVVIHRPFESPTIVVNETEGYVCVTALLPPDHPKVSGTFVLTSITFRAALPGNSTLNLYNTYLIGFDIKPMPHTTIDGSVTVHAPKLLLETDKHIYKLGESITITLKNIGNETVEIGGYPAWQIFTYQKEEPVYPDVFLYLAWSLDPGENDTFSWNQYTVSPGTYVVRDTQGWGLSAYFKIILPVDMRIKGIYILPF